MPRCPDKAVDRVHRRQFIAATIDVSFPWLSAFSAPKRNAHVGYLELLKEPSYRYIPMNRALHGRAALRTIVAQRHQKASPKLRSKSPRAIAVDRLSRLFDRPLPRAPRFIRRGKTRAANLSMTFPLAD
jgi:hypothetical protein